MMNTNFKWHYSGSNVENMNPQPALHRYPDIPPVINQPQPHHAQYPHYPHNQQNLSYQQNFYPPQNHPNMYHPPVQQNPKVPEYQNNFYQTLPHSMNEQFMRNPQHMEHEKYRQQQIQRQQAKIYQQRMQNHSTIHYHPHTHLQNQLPKQPFMPPPAMDRTPPYAVNTPPYNVMTPPQAGVSPPNIKPIIFMPTMNPIKEPSVEMKPPTNFPFDFDFPTDTNDEEEFDINHFLRLDFADDENPSRKRKMNDGNYESQVKRPKRRTRAEIIEDKNQELIRQCKPLYIPLENMFVPSQVRIYGNCEYRYRSVRVHRTKLTPKNEEFHKIKNIGFLRTSNGTAFGCFVGLCRFKTYKKDDLKKHLDTYHRIEGAGSKEGYCQMCDKNNCGFSLTDELAHMESHHLNIPYEATYLILYSRINNELTKKAEERRARNRELKEKMDLERTLALFDDDKEPDEIYVPQEAIDDGNDDDYNPESEPESEDEIIEEPEVESEEDIAESPSVASSDMESEELEEDEQNIPLADDTSDSDIEKPQKRKKSKQNAEDKNQVPCSQPSQTTEPEIIPANVQKEDIEIDLVEGIPQYMLQRIKLNIGIASEGPQFTESFTNAIREMLKPNEPKNSFARKSTTIGFIQVEPEELPKCSVRVKRLESCESLKKFISEDETSKSANNMPQIKDTIDSKKSVMPDIPTPPTSEDSRDSMISPPIKAQNETKKLQESIENITNKMLSKISFPSLRSGERVSESDKEIVKKSVKPSPPLRVSLRDRRKSIAVSRRDEFYYRDDELENGDIPVGVTARNRRKSNYTPNAFEDIEEEIVKEKSLTEVVTTSNSVDENLNKIIAESQAEPNFVHSQASQISSQSTLDNGSVIEIISSQEENQTFTSLQSLYPWIDHQVSSKILKSKRCTEILTSENCLFSTYKCLKQNCSFFTTSNRAFKIHAEKHVGDHNFCSFCLYDGVSGEDLSNHLKSHDLDRYQCSKCMYRASEKMYVEWHRKKFHPKENVKILKSPIQKLGVIRRAKMKTEIEQINWAQFVKPYECSTPFCNKKFFSKNNYREHLIQESKKQSLDDNILEIVNQISIIDHKRALNRKDTKEGQYQCLYCLFGSDTRDEIQIHLSDQHASSLGFICQRSQEFTRTITDKKETLETHTSIVYIGQEKDIKVKFYPENKSKENLSTPDYLAPRTDSKGNEDEQISELAETTEHDDGDIGEIQDISNASITNSPTQKKFPVISEIIHIESY